MSLAEPTFVHTKNIANTRAVCKRIEGYFPDLRIIMSPPFEKVNARGYHKDDLKDLRFAAAVTCREDIGWLTYPTIGVPISVFRSVGREKAPMKLFFVHTEDDDRLHALDLTQDLSKYPFQDFGRGRDNIRPGETNPTELARYVPRKRFVELKPFGGIYG